MENLRLLKTFATQFEAELVKAKLERNGIETMLQGQDLANVLPSLDYAEGIHLFVEPEDFDTALALVDSPDDDLSEDMEIGTEE